MSPHATIPASLGACLICAVCVCWVSWANDDPNDCIYVYIEDTICSDNPAAVSCPGMCHQATAGCPNTEVVPRNSTAQKTKTVNAGNGQKKKDFSLFQCVFTYICDETRYTLTECKYTGSGISYCNLGVRAETNCYVCNRGMDISEPVLAPISVLEPCIFH